MIRFKDFPIKILKKGNWLNYQESEKVSETLLRINNWVEQNEFIVLNIETLFFPNLHSSNSSTGSPMYKDSGGHGTSTKYYQVFRVWHRESKPMNNI